MSSINLNMSTNERLQEKSILEDKELRSWLLPLEILNNIMLMPKYRIRNNVITPNRWYTHIFSIIGMTILIIPLIIESTTCFTICALFADDRMVYYFGVFLGHLAFVVVVFYINNYVHRHNHVLLILNIYKIRIFLNKNELTSSIKGNYISVTVVAVNCILMQTFRLYLVNFFPFDFEIVFSFIVYDIFMIYLVRIISLLTLELELLCVYLRILVSSNIKELNKINLKNVVDAYNNILEAYNVFKRICYWPMMVVVTQIFTDILKHVSVTIFLSGNATFSSYLELKIGVFFAFTLLTTKRAALIIMLSTKLNQFYNLVSKVESIATIGQAKRQSGDLKKACKSITRYNRAEFTKCRCGFFTIDAALPLKLLSVVATYVIVLLQFALLK